VLKVDGVEIKAFELGRSQFTKTSE
jgi:hypothetical protein